MSTVPSPSGNSTTPSTDTTPLLEQVPENTIAETLRIKGELSYESLLRIDGYVEGKLITTGSLIIGPLGSLVGHVNGLDEVWVEGKIFGDIKCRRLTLKGQASVKGNISCVSMAVDPSCRLEGQTSVVPAAAAAAEQRGSNGITTTDTTSTTSTSTRRSSAPLEIITNPVALSQPKGEEVYQESLHTEKDDCIWSPTSPFQTARVKGGFSSDGSIPPYSTRSGESLGVPPPTPASPTAKAA